MVLAGIAYWLIYWSPDIMIAMTGLVAAFGLFYSCITEKPFDPKPLDKVFETHQLSKDQEHRMLYIDLQEYI